jgi:hypothetical protein
MYNKENVRDTWRRVESVRTAAACDWLTTNLGRSRPKRCANEQPDAIEDEFSTHFTDLQQCWAN